MNGLTEDVQNPPTAPTALGGRPRLTHLLACFIAYMLAAGFGQWMMVIPHISITIWPPNGIILAALLASERQKWPWWIAVAVVGELTANAIWFHNPFLPALGYIAVNALEVVLAANLLALCYRGSVVGLATLDRVLAFLAIAVLAAPAIGATLGSAIDAAIGKNTFWSTWPLWWLGDATGILLATPLSLAILGVWRAPHAPTLPQIIEGFVLALVLVVTAIWQFATDLTFGFLLLIPVLWGAMRFEMLGAVLATLLLALIIGVQAHSNADFSNVPVIQHAKLQLLIIVAASLGLIVAAILQQYRFAMDRLSSANSALEQRVKERTRDIEAAEKRFRATFKNAAVGIALLESDGRLTRVNESLAKFLGYTVDELEGYPLDHFTHSDDLPSHRLAWERLAAGEADHYTLEKRYRRKNGETVWGHASVSCVHKADGTIDYLIKVIQDVTARRRSDEARQLLMLEVNHRSKNLLSMIQSIARQTAARTPAVFIETFSRRLQALAANQDLLVESGWQRVGLEDLVRSQLRPFEEFLSERIVISGPEVLIPARVAQSIAMAIHELATNAAKYGSLSTDAGKVEINWTVDSEAFDLWWREIDGPIVTKPSTNGFGATVIDDMVRTALGGSVCIDFAPTGVQWHLHSPVSVLREDTHAPRAY